MFVCLGKNPEDDLRKGTLKGKKSLRACALRAFQRGETPSSSRHEPLTHPGVNIPLRVNDSGVNDVYASLLLLSKENFFSSVHVLTYTLSTNTVP